MHTLLTATVCTRSCAESFGYSWYAERRGKHTFSMRQYLRQCCRFYIPNTHLAVISAHYYCLPRHVKLDTANAQVPCPDAQLAHMS